MFYFQFVCIYFIISRNEIKKMKEVFKNWQQTLFTAALSIIGMLIVQSLFFQKTDAKDLQTELNDRPKFEYVDKQDNSIRKELSTHAEEDKAREQITEKWMQSIDQKLNILITRK